MQRISYDVANQEMHNHIKDILNRYGGKLETITLGNIAKNNIFFEDLVIITNFKGYFLFNGERCSIEIEPSSDYQSVRVAVWHNIELLTEKCEGNLYEFNLTSILDKITDKIKAKKEIKEETESNNEPF